MVKKTAPVSAPVVETPAPVVENVVVEKTPKAPRTKKAKVDAAPVLETPEQAPVVEAPSPVAPAVETQAPVADAAPESVASKLSEFSTKIQQYVSLGASLKAEYKALERYISRELKNAQKASSKKSKSKNSGNRKPSGFVKPTLISNELATFLGKPEGIEMARTEVSKEINSYIRAHDLKNKENGRKIMPDASLKKLLNIGDSDELTFFNLQRYIKHHFVKQEPVVTA
jgi:chromatin remodeling complex protein RSC6